MLKDAMSARHAKPEQGAFSIPFITQEKQQELMKDEDDDIQGFEPDWANFQEGRAVGWTEAFERIAEKIKEMPWEDDTKNSFLIWLKGQK
jgi:broad specificity phosphatase PhoE